MIRTIINKLPLPLLALFLFASCDNEEYGQEENISIGSEKIHFEIVVGTATTTSSEMQTRVATSTDGNYTSTWNNGDAIGVYIVKGSGGLQSSGNWVDNMQMTYNNGSWTPIFPSGKEYYPTDGDELNFYAYYPYNASVTDALNMTISGLTDQSSAANLSKSDLLSASTLNVEKGNTTVQLSFSHALTMVELSVYGGPGAQMTSDIVVTLEGCKPDVSFNLSTRAANAASSVKSVKMYRVEQLGDADYLTKYTYRTLVPTQTIFTGAQLFRFSQTQGTIIRTLSHNLTSNVALWPGEVKPYTITLQPSIDPNHVYDVGDYYPYKGFPILGVVFEVSNGGKNGKVLSLEEKIGVSWGALGVNEQSAGVVGIRDANDGQPATKNIITKRKGQADFANKYEVFNWIYQEKNKGDINGPWYLPATAELTQFATTYNADQSAFNAKLTEVGLEIIWNDADFRAITEYDNNTAYLLRVGMTFIHLYVNKESTTWGTRARAIRKF